MVIIVAVDRSGRSARVVSEATSLMAAFGETVRVTHALTRSELIDLGLTNTQTEEPKDMDEVRPATAEMAEDSVPGLNVPCETVGLVGNSADEVIEYVDGQDASYIAVSPRCRSRTGKMLFGSVAQSVLLNASYPVVPTPTDEEQRPSERESARSAAAQVRRLGFEPLRYTRVRTYVSLFIATRRSLNHA